MSSFILTSNLTSQFNWSKQLSIRSGEEESEAPAVAGGPGALIKMGRWMEEFKLCVYLRCRRAFLGRQGSGKAPLEHQRHSQQRPEGNKIQRSGRKTRPEQSKKHKKRSDISPPLHHHLPSESNPQPLRDSLFTHDGQDLPFCLWDTKQIQLRENNGGRGSLRVPQKQFMYNKHSHRKSKKSAPRIIPERKFQKQHSAQEEEERYGSPFPRFSFQTIKGTPD